MSERINTPFTNEHFVAFCEKMLGQPYWYGSVVYKCTENLRARKAKQYPAHYGSSRTARYRDDIAKKKVCADCDDGRDLFCCADDLRIQRDPQFCVADHSKRIFAAFDPAVEQGIIGKHRADPCENSCVPVPVFMDVFSCFFSCDPAGCSRSGCNPAVHRHGVFQRDIGHSCLDIMEEDRIYSVAFFTHEVFCYFYAVLPKDPGSFAGDQRVGIT